MRRIALIILTLLATVGVVTACSKPQPAVAFYAAGHSVSTLPYRQCADITLANCKIRTGAAPSLAVPAGLPLEISVAPEVAGTVWTVAYQYKDSTGAAQSERSAVFTPNTTYAYTLYLSPADQLTYVEVDEIGAITMSAGDTAPTPQASVVWNLNVTA